MYERAVQMTAKVSEESVISHVDEIKIFNGHCEMVEFRVRIIFTDEEGRDWAIDKVYQAQPRLDK